MVTGKDLGVLDQTPRFHENEKGPRGGGGAKKTENEEDKLLTAQTDRGALSDREKGRNGR